MPILRTTRRALVRSMPGSLLLIWACFLARLGFYAAVTPLWEGWDEYAHFAVIRAMARGEGPLVARDHAIPRDVEASLQLAPVPYEMRDQPWPSVTRDAFWKLPREVREQRAAEFRAMPANWAGESGTGGLQAYEGLQPPLYYWLMTPALRLMRGLSLAAQVMVLRWLSCWFGSLIVPLVFLTGREAFDDDRLALGCAAVAAVMPGLAIDVARVGNECVAVALFTALIWIGLRRVRTGPGYGSAALLGAVLGFGLLAKAYFLTAAPPVALLLAWEFWRNAGRRRGVAYSGLIIAAESMGIAGWWYLHNLRTTGTLSGLSESVMLRGVSFATMLHRASEVHWGRAIDAILFSHIYFGGWSSLTIRSWMYHFFYAVILVAGVGLLCACGAGWYPARRLEIDANGGLATRPQVYNPPHRRKVSALAAVYGAFWVGQLYNVMLLYLSKGVATSMGWYMYAVVAAEVVLCVAGLRWILPARLRRWATLGGAFLFALLDLYTVHAVAAPYYAGLIRHRPNGALIVWRWGDFQGIGMDGVVQRLAGFQAVSETLLVVLWVGYVAGTLAAVWCAVPRKP